MLFLLPVLFGVFALSTAYAIFVMLGTRPPPATLERYRLWYFFLACLLLVCLVPLWLYGLVSRLVLATNLAAVVLNGLGALLTLQHQGHPKAGSESSGARRSPRQVKGETRPAGSESDTPELPDDSGPGIRVYTLYYQGAPFGLITKGAFDKLAELDLLKRQRTVELRDDYLERARRQGVKVQQFKNRDGSQTLIKVLVPDQE